MLYLKPQTTILADLVARTRDTEYTTWSAIEVYNAVNDGLTQWAGRVSSPMVYIPADNWPDDAYYVVLPSYMDSRMVELQVRRDDDEPWSTYNLATMFSPTTTTRAIQIPWRGEMQYQVLFYVENKAIPTALPTLDAEVGVTDVTLSVSPAVDIAPAGWIKIDSEYISYTGIENSATNTVLSGLGRTAYGSTGASHLAGATVEWCVHCQNTGTYSQLLDSALARMYELSLADSSTSEQSFLERMVSFYSGRAQDYWRRHQVSRSPRWMPFTTSVPVISGSVTEDGRE